MINILWLATRVTIDEHLFQDSAVDDEPGLLLTLVSKSEREQCQPMRTAVTGSE